MVTVSELIISKTVTDNTAQILNGDLLKITVVCELKSSQAL